MRQLLRPTLVRRVFMALLIASSLIWVLMMGLNLYLNMGEAKTTEELVGVRDYLVQGLHNIDDEKAAAAFVQGAVGETHRDAYNWRNFRSIKYMLKDDSGRVLIANPSNWRSAPEALAGQARPMQIRGQR